MVAPPPTGCLLRGWPASGAAPQCAPAPGASSAQLRVDVQVRVRRPADESSASEPQTRWLSFAAARCGPARGPRAGLGPPPPAEPRGGAPLLEPLPLGELCPGAHALRVPTFLPACPAPAGQLEVRLALPSGALRRHRRSRRASRALLRGSRRAVRFCLPERCLAARGPQPGTPRLIAALAGEALSHAAHGLLRLPAALGAGTLAEASVLYATLGLPARRGPCALTRVGLTAPASGPAASTRAPARQPLRPEVVGTAGILQPIEVVPSVRDYVGGAALRAPLSCRLRLRGGAAAAGGAPQAVLRLTSAATGESLFRWLWPVPGMRPGVAVHRGEVVFVGPLPAQRPRFSLWALGASLTRAGVLELSAGGSLVARVRLAGPWRGPLDLAVGSATAGAGDVDFAGDVFEARVWPGLAADAAALSGGAGGLPAPPFGWLRDSECAFASQLPWARLRTRLADVLACGALGECELGRPPYRIIALDADVVAYRDPQEFRSVSRECPLGFAVSLATIIIFSQLESDADAVAVSGMLKLIASSVPPGGKGPEPTFGHARPLTTLNVLQRIGRRRLAATLGLPTPGAGAARASSPGRTPRARANGSSAGSAPLPPGLCVRALHSAAAPLAVLRGLVETLAGGGVLRAGVGLAVRITDCGAPWDDPAAPEGWYLGWLRVRFGAVVVCGAAASETCGGGEFILHVTSAWYLLPFGPELVAERIHAAMSLLQGTAEGEVVAVSLSEKSLHGIGGVRGSGQRALASAARPAPRAGDLRALAEAVPALANGWDVREAARLLAGFHSYFAPGRLPNASWLTAGAWLGAAQRCGGGGSLCAPAEWWPPGAGSWEDDSDVWLVRGGAGVAGKGGGRLVALSHGLMDRARGEEYEPTAVAQSLGVPDCFACHQVPLQGDEDFELFLAPVDVIGPCRELFSNLLLDALEALQLASFQGPRATLVEPMIANAVWKRFNQEQAAQHSRRAEEQGWTTSIYSFWNAETACGLRHGSPTRFGDMFDWPALSEWLRSARGIRGTTTWREFQARTGQALDAVAMLSGHPGDPLGEKLPCADADGPTVMRFFDADFAVARRVCVQSTSRQHEGGFNLRFLDMPRLADAVRGAVARARREGRRWAAVGLYLYWVEGAERARLHPARYGKLSTHSLHMSIFRGLHFAPAIERRAAVVMSRLGLRGQPFLAVHWRRGDWFLGPHPRKLEQAALAEPPAFARVVRRHLREQSLRRVFLMTNAAYGGADVRALAAELSGFEVVQAPVIPGDRHQLRQLCVEMAVASAADFFVAFGDGLAQGMASMPSLLVLQLRLHTAGWPLESNAFSFVEDPEDALGI